MRDYDPIKHAGRNWNYAHVKRNGNGISIVWDLRNNLRIFSNRSREMTEELAYLFQDGCLKYTQPFFGMVMYAELFADSQIPTEVRSRISKQLPLNLEVFQIEKTGAVHPQMDYPLETVRDRVEEYGYKFMPYLPLGKLMFENDGRLAERLNWAAQNSLHLDMKTFEGFILKDSNSRNHVRWKPRKTIDLIIKGYRPADPNGKYAGQIGSIVCQTIEGFEVADVSGMNDNERRIISERQDAYIGQMVEVAYQNVGANGRLFHPAFVQFRYPDEKDINRCDVSQDVALAEYWNAEFKLK